MAGKRRKENKKERMKEIMANCHCLKIVWLLPSPSLHCSLTGQQAKKITNEVLRQGIMTLFRKPAAREDSN